jgi:hypothetical protein
MLISMVRGIKTYKSKVLQWHDVQKIVISYVFRFSWQMLPRFCVVFWVLTLQNVKPQICPLAQEYLPVEDRLTCMHVPINLSFFNKVMKIARNPEGKKPLGRPRRRWQVDIILKWILHGM